MRRRFNKYSVECSRLGIAVPGVSASSPMYALERALQMKGIKGIKLVKVESAEDDTHVAKVCLLGGIRESVSYYALHKA